MMSERYGWNGVRCYPTNSYYTPSRNVVRTHEGEENGEENGKFNEVCVPLPTEEFGFASSICAEVDFKEHEAEIFVRVDGVGKVTIGTVSYVDSVLTVDIGVTFSVLGQEGFGGTLGVVVNKASGVISACFNLEYGVGTVAPWYTIITSMGDVIPA